MSTLGPTATTSGLTSTVYLPPTNAIIIAAGSNIQAAIDSHPAGTAFLLSAGTYSGQTIAPLSGDSFYGQNGQAVLDGIGAHLAFKGQGVANVTLSGLVITNYAPPPNGVGAIGTDASAMNWVIQACKFTQNTAGPALMIGTNMIVQDCSIYDNQMAGIGGWNVTGALIKNNEIYGNNKSGESSFTPTSNNAGIKIAQCIDTQIIDNYVHDNSGAPGVWTDISCSGTIIESNKIVRNGEAGIIVELDYGSTISGNLIQDNNNPELNGFQGGGIYIQNSSNANVHDNTLTGNGGGIWVYQSDRGSGTQGPWVVNNDLIHNNIIQMSMGQNGFGGTVSSAATNWTANSYYLSGSAELIASVPQSVAQWVTAGYDPMAGGSIFSSGSVIPTSTPSQDLLILRVSEDAWKGDAQFAVKLDGKQIGGLGTASALYSNGDTNVFLLTGTWGQGPHTVQIQFINDAYGGTATTDRNLYVNSISYDGTTYRGTTATMYSNSTDSFVVGGTVLPASGPADMLTVHLSEDAWKGDAQFAVSIDGKQITTPQAVVALHSAGAWEDLSFGGDFGGGSHKIGITFTNDAYGGTSITDRNLYILGIDVNGQHYGSGVTALLTNGTASFGVVTAH
jgi:parallel beta-helix repeat protein